MFETLDQLNRTLPKPEMTGNVRDDIWARERYISNAKALRSEAFACLARSMASTVRRAWSQVTTPHMLQRSH